ncbi:hypothetical protein L596_005315 [Steinernema carpocapsae]|uniref:Uncharacterized protein n=1 Tax=Steinernema carpocapsae TaxID=34508 RepID=A0A4U8V030_STECR|nr:hypothetical protein L596_005315 [Steinernema carpocapsae]
MLLRSTPLTLRLIQYSPVCLGSAVSSRFCSTSGKGNNVPTLKKPILQYHEEDLAGTKQRWNYRSEIVNARNLDRPHRNIWIAFGLIIIIGFTGFVYVKTMVIEGRKEEMLERERLRREMNLTGSNRRRIGVVD